MGSKRVATLPGLLCLALVLGGCGGGQSKTTSKTPGTTQSAGTRTQAPAAANVSPLTKRVLHSGELQGMNPQSSPTVERDLTVWVAGSGLPPSVQNTEASRLRRLGFVAGIDENLVTPANQGRFGLSLLEQFSSHSGAAAEFAHATSPSGVGGPATFFAVAGIPAARGFESLGGSQSGRNVAFTDGNFYYLVGAGWTTGPANAVSRAQVIAAALRLYHRDHGLPAGG